MVNLSNILRAAISKRRIQPRRKYKGFIDSVKLKVVGGPGGNGFPKYGGIGGQGGSVILETVEDISLHYLKYAYGNKLIKGRRGGDSGPTNIIGKHGVDTVVEVPPGLTIIDQNNFILGEIDMPGQQIIVARGGSGGCLQSGFNGVQCKQQVIRLDLKLIANIGLVGFPNAGKSTLLKAITMAKPKVASYPFTTITPNVGSMMYEDLREISIADLPGLIEGAHRNIGMGHQFLRHCERTQLLLLVVDIQGFQLSRKFRYRSCLETVILLNKELELYREFLLDKPAMLLLNKMDTERAWDIYKEIERPLHNLEETFKDVPDELRPNRPIKFDRVLPMSVKFEPHSVLNLKYLLRDFLDTHAADTSEDDSEIESHDQGDQITPRHV